MKSINSKLWFDINPIIKENDFGNLISEIIELKLNNENYLLINGLTGAIDIVNFEEYDCIFKRKDNSVYKNTYLNLCKRGYYLTKRQYHLCVQKLNKRIERDISLSNTLVFIVVTSTCSMGCIYCIEGNKPTSIKPQTLKFKTVDSLLIALDELKQQGRKLSIMLFGGEPLQKSTLPIIEYLLKKFKESDYKSILFSNSLDALLFKDTIDKYRDIIISYNTTIDGEENYHNGLRNNKKSFKAVVNTIDELVKMNIPINIRTNIGKENLNSIVFLYEFYKKKKWWNNSNISFEIAPLTSHDSANIVNEYTSHSELTFFFKNLVERDSEYLHFNYYGILGHLYYPCRELKLFSFPDYLGYNMSIPRKHGCTIGGNLSFVFTPSGSINNCNEECLSESNRIGSYFPELIWDDNLSGVWTKRDVFSVNRCSICKYKFLCGGGCVRNVIMSNSQNDVLDCSIKSDYESFFPLIVADILRTWIR